jgi:predicted ABC-type ATPase
MAFNPPRVVIIAGPNGAGKSTSAPKLLRGPVSVDEFVNADVIARGLSEFQPESVALEAGRIMLERVHKLASQRANFAFETTLASRSFAPWIRELIGTGYEFYLLYLWLPAADFAIARVAQRVKAGGHHVPDDTIRRRHVAGMRNFFELYRPLAIRWRWYNNAVAKERRLIASGNGERNERVYDAQAWSRIKAELGINRR